MVTDALFDGDDDAATPLTAEEREALIPSYVTLRREPGRELISRIHKAVSF